MLEEEMTPSREEHLETFTKLSKFHYDKGLKKEGRIMEGVKKGESSKK